MSAVKYAAIFFVIFLSTIGRAQADVGELKIDGRKPTIERKKLASSTTKKHKQSPAACTSSKKAVVIIRQPCPSAPQPQCSMADVSRTAWQQFDKKVKEETPRMLAPIKKTASRIAQDVSTLFSRATSSRLRNRHE